MAKAILCALRAPKEAVHNRTFNVGSSEQNYQVKDIATIVGKAFPGCEVTIGGRGSDARSYRVDFEKIHELLPEFRCDWTPELGARQLLDVFSTIDLSEQDFRYPAGVMGGLGLTVMAAGLALLAVFPHDGTTTGLVWRMAVCGVGFGFFQSPNNRALLTSAPRARSGAAGGMLSTARLLGQTLGAAGVAILFRAYPARGSNLALCVAAAIALLAALVSMVRLAGNSAAATH